MLFTLSLLVSLLSVEAYYSSNAWQSLSDYPDASDFPEIPLLQNRPNTAIAFTGGGSRAYVASIGILAGLQQLDLLKNVRYVGGISGGAWATTTYTYAQNIKDDVLLGPVVNPEQISQSNLKIMDPKCARGFAAANLTLIALNAYKEKKVDSIATAWCYGVSKTYLEPAGIVPGKKFSWDASTVKDIVKRNRKLSTSDFVVPNPNRPFSIIGTTLVGPSDGAPYTASSQNYTMIEITPLYVGQLKKLDVTYQYQLIKHTKTVSGAIEPFAFAVDGDAPFFGLASNHKNALLNVPEPTVGLDLQFAAGASGYAPGALIESLRPPNLSAQGLHFDYWSPSNEVPRVEDTLFADGGSYQNIPLISFIQRRVSKIVLFFVSSTPLKPADKYNPYTDPFTGTEITDCLTAFFGILTPDQANWEDRSYQYEKDQVFAREDYPRVVSALQKAQADGNGIIATLTLTTIENTWWGIPAGLTFEITFSYLGRLKNWESKLSSEMHSLLVPAEGSEDLSQDIQDGPYAKFPHYATIGGDVSYDRANVLADLTGWSILQNADTFRKVLS